MGSRNISILYIFALSHLEKNEIGRAFVITIFCIQVTKMYLLSVNMQLFIKSGLRKRKEPENSSELAQAVALETVLEWRSGPEDICLLKSGGIYSDVDTKRPTKDPDAII